jgi:hypothetical protein
MAVIKVSDSKTSLPPIIRISIGRASVLRRVSRITNIFNKPVV